MASTTIVFGLLLTVLGLGGYLASGSTSPTALIPAIFGLLLMVLGFLARGESMRKHAMHGAAMVGLVGLITAIASLLMTPAEMRPALALDAQIVMLLLTGAFLLLCIRSFRAARLARAAKK